MRLTLHFLLRHDSHAMGLKVVIVPPGPLESVEVALSGQDGDNQDNLS